MSRLKVVIADRIAASGIEDLSQSYDVIDAVGQSREELLDVLTDASALIVRSATQIDREMIEQSPELVVIGRAGIGVDNIDVDAATANGVLVVNTPDANSISAAEHTMAMLLAQARRIPEADRSLRSGKWDRSNLGGIELHGKTLGILGLGKIGVLVAHRAAAFGMRIVAYDPYVTPEAAELVGVELMDLDDVFATADMLTIHLPRNEQTENIINAESIAKMKTDVRIVNVARGGVVNEQDLADAVRDGAVGGAAIDVYDTEPSLDSPLFDVPEIVVTPHLGASTREAQDRAGTAVAEVVRQALSGETVASAVNVVDKNVS